MGIKDKIKEIENKWDLSKKYPNYINKIVFRIGLAVVFCFVFYIIGSYGFNSTWVNVECPSSSYTKCQNPYILCENTEFIKPQFCEYYDSHPCEGINCEKEFISAGGYIGVKPPWIIEYSNFILIFILLITFLVNHVLYKVKT